MASLADEISITVAVHDAPMVGKEVARLLFAVLSHELEDFELTEELIEGKSAAALFEATIRGKGAQGSPWCASMSRGRFAS